MTGYEIFKFLHVVFSIAWIGGGITMLMLTMAAERRGDTDEKLRTLRAMSHMSRRFFVPAAIGAFVTGLLTAGVWPVSLWGQAWIWFGLSGFAASAVVGSMYLAPRAARLAALHTTEGASPPVLSLADEIVSIARFDAVLLIVIVADMVFKPIWREWWLLLIFLLIIGAAAWFFLQTILQPMMASRSSTPPPAPPPAPPTATTTPPPAPPPAPPTAMTPAPPVSPAGP